MSKQEVFAVTIDGIDQSFHKKSFEALFKSFTVKSIYVDNKKWRAYVNFLSESDAQRAIEIFNGRTVNSKVLRVALQPRIDFKKLTDCKYEDGCANKTTCPYRHVSVKAENCQGWMSKKCKKLNCQFAHPSLSPVLGTPEPLLIDTKVTIEESTSVTEEAPSKTSNVLRMLECAICYETMEDPQTLPCRHSFCKDCLNDWLKFVDRKPQISCPTCRKDFVLPYAQTISCYEPELTLKQLLDELKESTVIPQSCRCFSDGCKGIPDRACMTCGIYICTKKCLIDHFVSQCKCENLVPIKYSARNESNLPYCEDHSCSQNCHCLTCDQFVCVYCVHWSGHEDHEVISRNDYIKKNDTFIRSVKDKASEKLSTFQQVKNAFKSRNGLKSVKAHMNNVKAEILSKTWLALNIAENEIINTYMSARSDFMQKNSTSLKKAQEIYDSAEELMNGDRFSQLMKLQNFKDKSQVEETDVADDFAVTFSPLSSSDCLFDMLDEKIGIIDLAFGSENRIIKLDKDALKAKQEFQDLNNISSQRQTLTDLITKDNFYKEIVKKASSNDLTTADKTKKKIKKQKKNEKSKTAINEETEINDEKAITKKSLSLIDFEEDETPYTPEEKLNTSNLIDVGTIDGDDDDDELPPLEQANLDSNHDSSDPSDSDCSSQSNENNPKSKRRNRRRNYRGRGRGGGLGILGTGGQVDGQSPVPLLSLDVSGFGGRGGSRGRARGRSRGRRGGDPRGRGSNVRGGMGGNVNHRNLRGASSMPFLFETN